MPARLQQTAWKFLILSAILALFSSAALRVTTGMAWAKSNAEKVAETAEQTTECTVNPDYVPVLRALQSREVAAQEREIRLNEYARALTQSKSEVEQQLQDLARAESALRDMIALAKDASESDLDQLTSVYQSMKPKEASALFEKMAPEFAAGFLGRMEPSAAAGILSGLDTDHAYAISVILAGRNAEIPLN